MIRNKSLGLCLIATLMLSGCATPNKEMYYWGDYEQIIHDSYITPGSPDTLTQIQKINTDIQQAENKGKKVPPGIYAHLAYLYALQGNNAKSKAAFLEEKTLFPEASVLIDGMMQRAKKNEAN